MSVYPDTFCFFHFLLSHHSIFLRSFAVVEKSDNHSFKNIIGAHLAVPKITGVKQKKCMQLKKIRRIYEY